MDVLSSIILNIKNDIYKKMLYEDKTIKSSQLIISIDNNMVLKEDINVLIGYFCEGKILYDYNYHPMIFNFDPLDRVLWYEINRKDISNYKILWVDFIYYDELLKGFNNGYNIEVEYDYYTKPLEMYKDLIKSNIKFLFK